MLHHQGIVMGEKRSFRPRLSVENPKGFYENIRFRALSDRILHESAYDVKSWNPLIPSIRASGVTGFRVRRLIEECCRAYSAWGWKDSRVCLTLGVWLDELDRLKLSAGEDPIWWASCGPVTIRAPTRVPGKPGQGGQDDVM